MEMTFRLQAFEGPLDLLLHLIDINKIDIYDIPIVTITDQYLAYIHEMQTEDMDVTSDFLVMAATLLRIKSQMLLPVEKAEAEESGEDPRLELVRRLVEYKMFRFIAGELQDDAFEAAKRTFKSMTIPRDMVYTPPPVDLKALVGDTTISQLRDIFEDVMRRQQDKIDPTRSRYGEIVQEPVNLADRMSDIRTRIRRQKKSFSFRKLLTEQATKEDVIVTFLAILELMKDGTIVISQAHLFDDIEILPSEQAAQETAQT